MKALAIARLTYQETSRQPATALLVLLFGGAILLSSELTLFTLDDPSHAIREAGAASILICGALVALFGCGHGLWRELEHRTAAAVLATPISREAFFLGKFLGVFAAVAITAALLGVLLLLVVWSGEGLATLEAPRPMSFAAALGEYVGAAGAILADRASLVLGAILLALVQLAMFTALAVTLSQIVPTAVNACVCLTALTAGHLSSAIAGLADQLGASLGWVGGGWVGASAQWMRAAALPNFEALSAGEMIAAGRPVPYDVLSSAIGYGGAWTAAVLLVGLALFHQRELM